MAHHIYTTEGIVLRNSPKGEANRFTQILTKELGLIGASVQAVRLMESKLRPNLEDYTYGTVSLVRGKHGWKITSAQSHTNFYYDLSESWGHKLILARIISLIQILCPGEEKNVNLFEIVYSALTFMKSRSHSPMSLQNFEPILILRILHNLGYVGESKSLITFAQSSEWSDELVSAMDKYRFESIAYINRSFEESHLV